MERAAAAALVEALAARRGIVCAVGAGGKKSTLYRLAQAHLALGTAPVGLTTTVMSAPPPREVASARLVAPLDHLLEAVPAAARTQPVLAFAQPSTKPGRVAGIPPEAIGQLHAAGGFALTLVKADGARMRLIKAPDPDEPVLPPDVATVLALVSIGALGRVLDGTIAHRPGRVAAVTGAAAGMPLTVAHLARLLASEEGALHNTGAATVVPVINMVDDDDRRRAARAIAREALAQTTRFERVVLASMVGTSPLVEVVTR
jgi:probable selenium-dependent hydroxylase accessory protein YqeC